jgi:hypothetical protein
VLEKPKVRVYVNDSKEPCLVEELSDRKGGGGIVRTCDADIPLRFRSPKLAKLVIFGRNSAPKVVREFQVVHGKLEMIHCLRSLLSFSFFNSAQKGSWGLGIVTTAPFRAPSRRYK